MVHDLPRYIYTVHAQGAAGRVHHLDLLLRGVVQDDLLLVSLRLFRGPEVLGGHPGGAVRFVALHAPEDLAVYLGPPERVREYLAHSLDLGTEVDLVGVPRRQVFVEVRKEVHGAAVDMSQMFQTSRRSCKFNYGYV